MRIIKSIIYQLKTDLEDEQQQTTKKTIIFTHQVFDQFNYRKKNKSENSIENYFKRRFIQKIIQTNKHNH